MGTQQMILLIAATVATAFVLFILFGAQQRGQDAAVDAVQYRAAKQDQLNLVRVLERDLRNVGSHLYRDPNTGAFIGGTVQPGTALAPGNYDSTAVTGGFRYRLRFLAQTDSASAPDSVRYQWAPNGESVTLSDGTVRPLLTFERFVNGTLAGWTEHLTGVTFRLRPQEGTPMVNLQDTRIFDLTLTSISSLGVGEVIEETRFDAAYRPVGIAITDRTN